MVVAVVRSCTIRTSYVPAGKIRLFVNHCNLTGRVPESLWGIRSECSPRCLHVEPQRLVSWYVC